MVVIVWDSEAISTIDSRIEGEIFSARRDHDSEKLTKSEHGDVFQIFFLIGPN
jgi:hypothetical protein